MIDIQIRTAQIDDTDALAALAMRSVIGLSTGFYEAAQADSASKCITAPDNDLIADGTLFVAVIDSRIVGCGAWSKRKKLYTGSELSEGSRSWLDPSSEPARIRAFFVDPAFARQGIARKLYEACREHALSQGFTRFELMATLPGVPLYKSLGFAAKEAVDLDLVDGTKLPAIRMSTNI